MPDREILFKARSVGNGEWVEGYYVAHAGCCHSIIPAPFGGYIAQDGTFYAPVAYMVDPSTVSRLDQWISVKDRLPEAGKSCFGKTYLVVANGKTMVMEYCDEVVRRQQTKRWKWHDKLSPWEVTHWMELPPPPWKEAPHD